MLCHTESKPAKSFIVVPSEKIQERAKVVLDECQKERKDCDDQYIRNWMDKENKRRKRWPQWWFRGPQLNFKQSKEFIEWEKKYDREHRDVFHQRHRWYPDWPGTREEVAERLLAMSKVERRVIVSSNDFDWFFR